VTFEQVEATGAGIILGNTYHLHLRPGHELVAERGGLQRFLGWRGAMLTDSAGFQVFSLTDLVKVDEDGVSFRSHLDGARLRFTPEVSMEIQLGLGADIIMAFDQCVPAGAPATEVAQSVDRTQRWLERCVATVGPGGRHLGADYERVLFGIMQGATSVAERRRHAAMLTQLELPGYAIGGLSVGEPKAVLHEMTAVTAELLPDDRPRYLMGVGYPDDIVTAVLAGVDMFDCVLPTRMARTGSVLTWDGRLVVKNRDYERDDQPIDPSCPCPVCRRHSRAYIRHLFQARELLGPDDATAFYAEVQRALTAAIESRIDEPVGGMTRIELRSALRRRGMDDALVLALNEELESCDFARFSSGSADRSEREACLGRAQKLLAQLDRFVPTEEAA